MKKRIDAKTVFMILMCVLVLIATLFPFWGVSLNGLLKSKDSDDLPINNIYTEIYRFRIFDIKNVNFYNKYTKSMQNAYEMLKDYKGGRYLTILSVSEILVLVVTGLAGLRLLMYILQICGLKLPKVIEKIVCGLLLTATILVLVLVVYMEFSCEISDGKYSASMSNDYLLKYVFSDMGFYLVVIPGFVLGLKAKEPKLKKKD